MSDIPSMQETIRRLHAYWAAQGCLIWQPHSEKLGAGTMNPATVLRVLGPEPWNVAYVEPSFRADDGRYAENPNRMQMHTQYQVIRKPDPGNPQELYLSSLEAIGLDRSRHDIRFVEDNWESPALGAWGLGWEVWLDGQEITQFTYFQQAGGVSLDPVSVEITYGLERLVMYLQKRTEVWSIDFDGVHTYGEIYRQQEIEHCIYNFELADVERQRMLCDLYNAEAEACIERGLVAPAHDYVLRQSQAFNILDTRGAIAVTERAKFFAAMRSQARRIAELYLEQRQQEEYPWLQNGVQGLANAGKLAHAHDPSPPISAPTSQPQSLLIELGSEELPAADVPAGILQMNLQLRDLLEQAQLAYGHLAVTGTPRRLVAHVQELAPRQRDEIIERKGPPAERAFDAAGQPTKAAIGFARGQGVQLSDLEVRDNYVYAARKLEGKPTATVLPQLIEDLLEGMRWNRTMRWNSSNKSYPRPLRWIVALYGAEIVPMSWAHVSSGRVSRGPRFHDARAGLPAGEFTTFAIADADSYFDAVAEQGIILQRQQRQRQIGAALQEAAARAGGIVAENSDPLAAGSHELTPEMYAALLEEVTDLVEAPLAILGSFEEKYLELPQPVLIEVMKKHQRYFPVVAKPMDGDAARPLLPYFVTIANVDALAHPHVVRQGNEDVIRARYADAVFFYRQDTARPLDAFTERLDTLTVHAKLGSMLEKVARLQTLGPQIAQMLGATDADRQTTLQAATLCKSDLVTSVVVEMTSLQGVMGEIYARKSDAPPAVAQAIREHYLPRFDGDAIPKSVPGLVLSLADKLDSLVGLFGVGVTPSGSADPFGLRRAALGIVNGLTLGRVPFDLNAALEKAASHYQDLLSDAAVSSAREFIIRRLERRMREELRYPADVVDAVLAARGDDPYAAVGAANSLAAAVSSPHWEESFTAYARCARIVRAIEQKLPLNPAAYQVDVERRLHAAYERATARLEAAEDQALALGEVLAELTAPINQFFDAVLVNAEDETIRLARQALAQRIALLAAPVADLSRLQGF